MNLLTAQVGPFKSISTPQTVEIDREITVLVGKNEAGKTVFLQALEKSNDALSVASFDPVSDYPRKDLPAYLKIQKASPAVATILTYKPTDTELEEINKDCGSNLTSGFTFSITHSYDNKRTIGIDVDEKPGIDALASSPSLSTDTVAAIRSSNSIRSIPEALKRVSLTDADKKFLAELNARIEKAKWDNVLGSEVFAALDARIPKFLYFGEYDLLPSKMNLNDLSQKVDQAKQDRKYLKPQHRATLALLRMADISIEDFTKSGGYEPLKAKIEGVSISLTDQIMEFWKQNEELEVEVDIKADPDDEPPFNSGPNLYLRIKNKRHRGVSTPFQQRSRGFIWFFSFLVWFDSVQQQIDTATKVARRGLILLLDEPGLALHALAQADFLRYIDTLSQKHQVLYTTHSPFMVHSNRLHQVRVVADQEKLGTVLSSNVSGSDPGTIFPLQAALGWTIAQNLFISERNLLVEGPSDLIYLKTLSAMLQLQGREGLRDDITIVPVGGLDKVVTFVALLGAQQLKLAVFHDYHGAAEQKLQELVKHKILRPKALLNASMFRDLANLGTASQPSDTEDLFPTSFYLDYFNRAYASILKSNTIRESDLPSGDRIIERIVRHLESRKIELRPSGGFNHYLVSNYFAANPPQSVHQDTLARFEALCKSVNSLL